MEDPPGCQHLEESNANAVKHSKESIATALCLDTAEELGLKGMVVYVASPTPHPEAQSEGQEIAPVPISHPAGEKTAPVPVFPSEIRAFTFGEHLGAGQSSITIEKTDLNVKGLAQFIFSEFCRLNWSDRPLVNVGDDWGLESLAWTKQSYRPVKLAEQICSAKSASGGEWTAVCTAEAQQAKPSMPLHDPVIRAAQGRSGCGPCDGAVELHDVRLEQAPTAISPAA